MRRGGPCPANHQLPGRRPHLPVDVHVLLHVCAPPQQGAAQDTVGPGLIKSARLGKAGLSGSEALGGGGGAVPQSPPHRLSSRSRRDIALPVESTTSCSTMMSQRSRICRTPRRPHSAPATPGGSRGPWGTGTLVAQSDGALWLGPQRALRPERAWENTECHSTHTAPT